MSKKKIKFFTGIIILTALLVSMITDVNTINKINTEIKQQTKSRIEIATQSTNLSNITSRNFVRGDSALTQAQEFTEDTIYKSTLFDGTQLNIKELPEIKVTQNPNNYEYQIYDQKRSNIDNRVIKFTNLPQQQWIDDLEVTAKFKDCITIDGKSVDMTIVYSDFYTYDFYTSSSNLLGTGTSSGFLSWSAYGNEENQTDSNEWFYAFPAVNLKIYFCYSGEDTPINIYKGYFTLYSEDGYFSDDLQESAYYQLAEATTSKTANKTYVYDDTYIEYLNTLQIGNRAISDMYYGTVQHTTDKDNKTAITYEYQNTDCVDFSLYMLNGKASPGYHLNFLGLGYKVDYDDAIPKKITSTNHASPEDELSYEIRQTLPTPEKDKFRLTSMVFQDTLDSNLIYKNLKVYNEKGQDITEVAGVVNVDNNTVFYTFKENYLESLVCTGQTYTFKLDTIIVGSPSKDKIKNQASTIFDYYKKLESNVVSTEIVVPKKNISLNMVKVAQEDNTKTLSGAKFNLYKYVGTNSSSWNNTLIDNKTVDDKEWELVGTYVSDERGKFVLEDLSLDSEYRLVEVDPPKGRKLSTGQWNISFWNKNNTNSNSNTDIITIEDNQLLITGIKNPLKIKLSESGELLVENQIESSYQLPLTGGNTVIIIKYVGASILLLGIIMAIVLTIKKITKQHK